MTKNIDFLKHEGLNYSQYLAKTISPSTAHLCGKNTKVHISYANCHELHPFAEPNSPHPTCPNRDASAITESCKQPYRFCCKNGQCKYEKVQS
ncbi:hypothetical protein MIMGU_mgv1a017133mg [Erythranthe guttata]|uniref:Uncharacterized protein n=1 Tax=Erythranthe guttata TaxID=4155 RepID=A0A022PZ36_ERYGU|nr:hypothetical protein MIMGU_mgv1a017133mg [Erythranthe guttata]